MTEVRVYRKLQWFGKRFDVCFVGVGLINVNSNARRVLLGPERRQRRSQVRETPSLVFDTHLNSFVRESSLNTRATCYCTGKKLNCSSMSHHQAPFFFDKRGVERLNRGSGATGSKIGGAEWQEFSPPQNVKNFLIATWSTWDCAFYEKFQPSTQSCDPLKRRLFLVTRNSVENSLIH